MNDPWGLYTLQLLKFFVEKHHYQVITIRQYRKDVWLMNAENENYPVILLSYETNARLIERQALLRRIYQVILQMTSRRSQLVILNSNPAATAMSHDFYQQVLIQPGACSDDAFRAAFPEIESAVYDVEDIKTECARITKSLEELQQRTMQERRQDAHKHFPKTTVAIIVLCVLIWLSAFSLSNSWNNDWLAALLCGAYYKMNIVSLHEYWRFFTAGWLHLDIIHLVCNMIALYVIGKVCEKSFTRSQYLIILIASMIMGNVFVFLTGGNQISLGISGGIFGLLGALMVTLFANGSIRHPMVKASVMRIIMINVMISLLPGISLFAHLGGLICGIFLGIIFAQAEHWKKLRVHVAICFSILVIASGVMTAQVDWVEPLSADVDRTYLAAVRSLGWDNYADRVQEAYLHYYSAADLGLTEEK